MLIQHCMNIFTFKGRWKQECLHTCIPCLIPTHRPLFGRKYNCLWIVFTDAMFIIHVHGKLLMHWCWWSPCGQTADTFASKISDPAVQFPILWSRHHFTSLLYSWVSDVTVLHLPSQPPPYESLSINKCKTFYENALATKLHLQFNCRGT